MAPKDQSGPELPAPLQQVEMLRGWGIDVSEIDHLAEQEAVDQLWEQTHNEIAAEYRFLGLLAGFPARSERRDPDHPDVVAAREAVVKAFEQFFGQDIREQADAARAAADRERDAILRDAPYMEGLVDQIYPQLPEGGVIGSAPYWTNAIDGAGVEYVDAIIGGEADAMLAEGPVRIGPDGRYTTRWENQNEALGRLRRLAQNVREFQRLEQSALDAQISNIIRLFTDAWDALVEFYDQVMLEINSGYLMLARNRVYAKIWEEGHLAIIAGAISLVLTGAMAGAGVVLLVSRSVFQAAVRTAIKVIPDKTRIRGTAAGAIMNNQISVARPNALGASDFASSPHYNLRVDTQNDLRESEKAIYDIGNQGTTRADDDQGVQTRPDSPDEDWFNDDGSLKREHWYKDPDLDVAEIRRQLGAERYAIAIDPFRSDPDAKEIRENLVRIYENFYGLNPAHTNLATGMDMNRQLQLIVYPPPDTIAQWVRARNDGSRIFGGSYYDGTGGMLTPDELGVNSVGRALEKIDLTQSGPDGSPVKGVAIEGVGSPIEDNWTFPDSMEAARRKTRGGRKQWYISKQYVDRLPQGQMAGTTWRDLPGNSRIEPYVQWVEETQRWNYVGRVEDGTSMNDLDSKINSKMRR